MMESIGARVAFELREHFEKLERYAAIDEQNRKAGLAASVRLDAVIMRETIAFNQVALDTCRLEWTKNDGLLTLNFRGKPTLRVNIEPGAVKLIPTEQNTSDSQEISFSFWHGEDGLRFQPDSAEDIEIFIAEEVFIQGLLQTACELTVRWMLN